MSVHVTEIVTAPVKGFALEPRDEVHVREHGVLENRRSVAVASTRRV